MRPNIIFALLTGAACFAATAAPRDVESQIAECPEKAGGIYYAYDVENDSVAPVPEGYAPVYISHYGRHGSRWPVKQKIYKATSEFFQDQQLSENLTPEGKRVWKLVGSCAGNAHGHLGELTPLGERQHRAIAGRMVASFPALFADSAVVVSRSSTEPRCIMSMLAFTDRLRELNPALRLERHASPGDMEFIHYSTPEAKQISGEEAPWMWDFHAYRDSVSRCPITTARLFRSLPQAEDSLAVFMRSLYDIAISVQDIDGFEADILPVFDSSELAALWKASNYMQYVSNGMSPASDASGARCAKMLLAEIADRADEMLASGEVGVDLRFGHDTDLLRLVSLTDMNGYGTETEGPEEVAAIWKNFEISPMGANLQLIFFRNGDGKVIVMPRLNEIPVRISDVPQMAPGFYDWELLKIYLKSL